MKKLFLSCAVIASTLSSCKNDDDGKVCNHVLEHTSLEEQYGCTNTVYDMVVDWETINSPYILIRNQTQFEQFVTGNCMPEIDFTKYDLVLSLMAVSDLESVSYSVIELCNGNISVVVYIEDTGEKTNLGTFHVLIPKLNESQNLEPVNYSS